MLKFLIKFYVWSTNIPTQKMKHKHNRSRRDGVQTLTSICDREDKTLIKNSHFIFNPCFLSSFQCCYHHHHQKVYPTIINPTSTSVIRAVIATNGMVVIANIKKYCPLFIIIVVSCTPNIEISSPLSSAQYHLPSQPLLLQHIGAEKILCAYFCARDGRAHCCQHKIVPIIICPKSTVISEAFNSFVTTIDIANIKKYYYCFYCYSCQAS